MPTQVPVLGNADMYGVASRRLLQLVPDTCNKAEKRYLDSLAQSFKSPSHGSRVPSPTLSDPQSSSDTHLSLIDAHQSKPGDTVSLSTQEETPLPGRVPSPSSGGHPHRVRRGSTSSTCSSVSATSLGSSLQPMANGVASDLMADNKSTSAIDINIFELIPEEMGYLNYLLEARVAIKQCADACLCWSSTYDRCTVTESREPDHTPDLINSVESAANTHSGPQLNVQSPDGFPIPIDTATSSLDSNQAPPTSSPTSSPLVRRRSIRRHSEPFNERFNDRVGLLLKVLLERLGNLLHNQPGINLLLTRVLTRLVCYPQPLLCSLLLNPQLVLKPGVPNLFHVSNHISLILCSSHAHTHKHECTHTHTHACMLSAYQAWV